MGRTGIAFAALLGILPQAACLPRDDLSSYSSAGEPSGAVGRLEPLDAAAGDGVADGGDDQGNDGGDALPDADGPSGPLPDAGAAPPELDAGGPLDPNDAGVELDAGVSTLDAALAP